MQFHESYFEEINQIFAPNFSFNDKYHINELRLPMKITEEERKRVLVFFMKIQFNREAIINYYNVIGKKISDIQQYIEEEISTENILLYI